jgi:hypothetical protein
VVGDGSDPESSAPGELDPLGAGVALEVAVWPDDAALDPVLAVEVREAEAE